MADSNIPPIPDPQVSLEIDARTVADRLAAGGDPGFTLVDCREEDEFALCRIEGATLLPLSGFPDNTAPVVAAPERPVVVYCHHGMRSAQAAGFLRHRGVTHAFSLEGGIDVWSQEIDPDVPRY